MTSDRQMVSHDYKRVMDRAQGHMTRYWSSFSCVFMYREGKNARKERGQISSILTEQAWPINESVDEILQCDYLKETPLEVSFT